MINSVMSELIGELYNAASGEAPFWPLAAKIASAFNSGSCILQVRNGFAGPIDYVAVTPNYTSELSTSVEFPLQNEIVINLQPGRLDQGAYHLNVVMPIGGPANAYGVLEVHRSQTGKPFSEEEKRQNEMFVPHLQRALQLRERLGQLNIREQAMLQTMETLALGMILVTSKGHVQFATPTAENLLRRKSGLTVNKNRLHVTAPSVDREFQLLLKCADQPIKGDTTETGGMIRVPREGMAPISLSIHPFVAPAPFNTDHGPSALILIGDPDLHGPPRREALAQMYRLTAAEAKLFEALLAGQRLQDYADRCAISLQTVKTQLNCLFLKTGSARQTDLVRDGLSNPILAIAKTVNHQNGLSPQGSYVSRHRLPDARPGWFSYG